MCVGILNAVRSPPEITNSYIRPTISSLHHARYPTPWLTLRDHLDQLYITDNGRHVTGWDNKGYKWRPFVVKSVMLFTYVPLISF